MFIKLKIECIQCTNYLNYLAKFWIFQKALVLLLSTCSKSCWSTRRILWITTKKIFNFPWPQLGKNFDILIFYLKLFCHELVLSVAGYLLQNIEHLDQFSSSNSQVHGMVLVNWQAWTPNNFRYLLFPWGKIIDLK